MTSKNFERLAPYEELYHTVVGAHYSVQSIGTRLKPAHTSRLTRHSGDVCVYDHVRNVYRERLHESPNGGPNYTIAIDWSSIMENDLYLLPGKSRIVPVAAGKRTLDRVQVDVFSPAKMLDPVETGPPDFSGQLLPVRDNGDNPPSVLLEGRQEWVPPELLLSQQLRVAEWVGCLARQLGAE